MRMKDTNIQNDYKELRFAAVGLDHGHITGICRNLIKAGAVLVKVYDLDPLKVETLLKAFPQAKAALCEDEVLEDTSIDLVASTIIPSQKYKLGLRVLDNGKDFLADKPGLISLEQLDQVKKKIRQTGLKYSVYYGEAQGVRSVIYAGQLIEEGAIGRILQVISTGPHRANIDERPYWFFEKEDTGGIITDIGSHQVSQFMYLSGAKDAKILHSMVANYKYKQYINFQDFGQVTMLADNGATCDFRVDWLTPDGLSTFGDSRTFILGTDGYIELRKYVEIGLGKNGDTIYLVNNSCDKCLDIPKEIDNVFFREFVSDCKNRTENAITQEITFKTLELSITAQNNAMIIEK